MSTISDIRINRYMERAIEIARTSKCRFQHGCVVVSNGQIVGESTNRIVNDQVKNSWRRSHMHAEIAALLDARQRAIGSTVYVARVTKDGNPASSEPCKKCKTMLEKYKVRNVVWT